MQAGATTRAERLAFAALAALVFVYVAARAVLVPVIHDEAMTFFVYVETGDFLPFRAHWDAGNHLLCTALAWTSWSVFGFSAWALRVPSVLAFVLYVVYAYKWGTRLQQPLIRWALWGALLGMPFLLDFFSLFRGYGLAMAFWSMALYEGCALLEKRNTKRLLLTLIAAACAAFSSLSLITLWAAVLGISVLVVMRKPVQREVLIRQLAVWLVFGATPFLFATAYAYALGQHGALYYGTTAGILGGTLPSILIVMFGGSSVLAVGAIVLILLGGSFVAWLAIRSRDHSFRSWALVGTVVLLWADLLGRQLLFAWNGTLFPEDRTALQWIPLFVLLFAFALDRLATDAPRWKWLALLLVVLPVRTIATANLRTTVYWPEQAIPSSIFRAAEQEQQRADHLLTIGAYHQMPACWGFGLRQRGLALNAVDVSEFPNGDEELLLIDPIRDSIPQGYRTVETAPGRRIALYARDADMSTTLLLDTSFTLERSDAEFKELWHPSVEDVHGRSYRIELEMVIQPDQEPMTGDLVVETDANGVALHNDHVLFQFMRHPDRSDSIVTVRHVPQVAMDAERLVVFLWNPQQQWYAGSGRLRVYRVER